MACAPAYKQDTPKQFSHWGAWFINQLQVHAVVPRKFNADREQFLNFSSELLIAMANPVRIEILTYLSEEEISVGMLGDRIGLSQSALSQHLAKLRSAGLVTTRREAQTIYYHSSSPAVLKTLDLLKEFFDDSDGQK